MNGIVLYIIPHNKDTLSINCFKIVRVTPKYETDHFIFMSLINLKFFKSFIKRGIFLFFILLEIIYFNTNIYI